MDEDFLKMLKLAFSVEAAEHLQSMSSGLLALEKSPTAQTQRTLIETVFRAAHSLKGAARATDMVEIESVCQSLEDRFASWKRREVIPTAADFDKALGDVDTMQAILKGSDAGGKSELNAPPRVDQAPAPVVVPHSFAHEFSAELHQEMSFVKPLIPDAKLRRETMPVVVSPPVAPTPYVSDGRPSSGEETVRISVEKLDARLVEAEEMLMVKLTMAQRVSDLRELGQTFDSWKQGWSAVEAEVHELRRKSDRRSSGHVDPSSPAEAGLDRILEFLSWNRDHFKRLEDRVVLMTRTAELDRRGIGKMVDDLLYDSKKLLLLPFSTLVVSFPKLVRDLARDQGKEIDLVIRGEQVAVDKRVLEEMKDPLIHLIRNCVDHGVETPPYRAELGKPTTATITISASPVNGNKVEILVSDDGAGIDTEKVKASAVKRSLISAEEATKLSVEEAHELIFRDEVSTSSMVTRLSGRGLGMAIVREHVEKLGGVVGVESQPGAGSVFRIVLPSMLATFRGVLVECAGQGFVVPTSLVERVARIKTSEIQSVEGRQTVRLSGRVVSLVRLADVLMLRAVGGRAGAEAGMGTVMVLGTGDQRIAFWVDAVLDEQEVLVKPLRKPLVRVRNIAGATVLGSGRVVPILNVTDLLKSARKNGGAVSSPVRADASADALGNEATEAGVRGSKSILVAEDSITSRMLIKNILESAGYRVQTAVDGMDAFVMLRAERFDLLVSDVEMPRLDGFGLTARVRAEKSLAELPIVLVTARETAEDKERGFDAGANAYIVKSRLDNSHLLEAVQRLV